MPEEISPTPTIQPTPPTPTLPARRINPVLIAAIIAVLALLGYLAWQAYSSSQNATPNNEATTSAQTATPSANPATSSATPIVISAALKENIAAAISSKNTAALEGYMAPSVRVVIAASSKNSLETPAQAVADLDYLSAGTAPWDFNLSAATLNSFKAGSYGTYFGDGTYVGQSTNKYVVSFGINSSGKIAVVFMAQNANLLN